MASRTRALVPLAVSLSVAALACSLPGQLFRSAASRAIDALEATPELPGAVGGEPQGSEQGTGGAVDLLGGAESSPAYDIYVGANVSGRCGPYTNSGGFEGLTFDSVIPGIRFYRPSDTDLPGPYGGITQEGEVPIPAPGIGLLGEGELGEYRLCPMYESPDAVHPCSVTSGPSPFEPSLSIGFSEEGVPVEPIVGTPVPSGGGEAVLVYSIGAASDLSPIMMWDCEMGLWALGGSLEPVQVAFSTSWDRLMLGEEFSLGAIQEDEGESWEWSIRFVPVE